jgi:hypothetical protein
LSLYECSISYSILKRSFAPRLLTTPSGVMIEILTGVAKEM